jgi:Protein of unknown function (DUF3995)
MGKCLHRADHQRAAQLRSVSAATRVVCGLLGLAVTLVMGKSGWTAPGPLPVLFDVGVWRLSLVFVLRADGNLRTFGFFKVVKGTPFADCDTWFYSPLCLLLALLAVGPVAAGISRSCGSLPDGRTPMNGHIPVAGLQRRFTETVMTRSRFYPLLAGSNGGALGERRVRISRIGGWPKKRLYSRLNWLALSYPTSRPHSLRPAHQ